MTIQTNKIQPGSLQVSFCHAGPELARGLFSVEANLCTLGLSADTKAGPRASLLGASSKAV